MKFLCVACDEPMTLMEAHGPDEGSMSVRFACPSCGQEVAMLTNPMETQMVRSLGIKLGGRTTAAEPMETIRHSLAHQREGVFAPVEAAPQQATPEQSSAGSRCPFTEVVTSAMERPAQAAGSPVWTAEAEARIVRIPSFARPMVRGSIEEYAREKGYAEIDGAVLDEVRGRFGM